MKTIKNKIYPLVILFAVGLFTFSCDVSQDWLVDSSYNRLFTPITFQTSNVGDTAVEVSFTRVIGAKKYILELSENDSTMQFENILQRIEVTTDTFKAYSINTIATKTEYRKKFTGLFGETNYSVRMIAVNEDSTLQSNYSMLTFKTLAEQLFNEKAIGKGLDSVLMKWNKTDKVTHIVMHPVAATDDTQDMTRILTAEEIAKAEASFVNLRSGTDYQFTIYYNEIKRGKVVVRTIGLPNSATYNVLPEDNATTISLAISGFIAENTRNINIFFDAGSSYTIIGLTIPDGVDNINFTGQADENGVLPQLTMNSLNIGTASASMIEASFTNLNINGNAANFCLTVPNSIITLKKISFDGCEISNFARGVISVSNVALAIDEISLTNNIISKIGGYGIVNVAGVNAVTTNINIKNSTMYDLTTHFVDFRNGAVFNMINCTFYNSYTTGYTLNRFLRSNDAAPFPTAINIQKCIFSGPNNGTTSLVGLTYKTATNTVVLPITSFAGSYSTSDFPLQYLSSYSTSYPNLQLAGFSSTDLFEDAANKDFRIKAGVVFAGKNVAGDPRWFTE